MTIDNSLVATPPAWALTADDVGPGSTEVPTETATEVPTETPTETPTGAFVIEPGILK